MRTKRGHFLVPIFAIAVGVALIYVGLRRGWGVVWAAAGGFCVVVGLGAELLALAWRLPGAVGTFLRRPIVGILIVGAVVAALAAVAVLGIVSRFS